MQASVFTRRWLHLSAYDIQHMTYSMYAMSYSHVCHTDMSKNKHTGSLFLKGYSTSNTRTTDNDHSNIYKTLDETLRHNAYALGDILSRIRVHVL